MGVKALVLDTIYKTPSLLGPLDTGKLATLLLLGLLRAWLPFPLPLLSGLYACVPLGSAGRAELWRPLQQEAYGVIPPFPQPASCSEHVPVSPICGMVR